MPHRALVSLLVALLLASCAAGPAPSRTTVRIAPDLDLVLPRPGDLGRSLDATQLVQARYGDQALTFEGHVSITPERLLLVVVDPLGRRALSVTWTDAGVTYDAAPWLPATVRPENMLADVVVLYWPEAVVRRSLVGGNLVATPGTRSILVAGHEVIHADYQPSAAGETWAGHAHYDNLPWGYDLDIQSVLSAP